MRLSWNEVRAPTAAFAEDWKDAAYEEGETQSFYNEFFEVFGNASARPRERKCYRLSRRPVNVWQV